MPRREGDLVLFRYYEPDALSLSGATLGAVLHQWGIIVDCVNMEWTVFDILGADGKKRRVIAHDILPES